MKLHDITGLREVAKFEKPIKDLNIDVFGIIIVFDDGSRAHLLRDDESLMREKQYAELIH